MREVKNFVCCEASTDEGLSPETSEHFLEFGTFSNIFNFYSRTCSLATGLDDESVGQKIVGGHEPTCKLTKFYKNH